MNGLGGGGGDQNGDGEKKGKGQDGRATVTETLRQTITVGAAANVGFNATAAATQTVTVTEAAAAVGGGNGSYVISNNLDGRSMRTLANVKQRRPTVIRYDHRVPNRSSAHRDGDGSRLDSNSGLYRYADINDNLDNDADDCLWLPRWHARSSQRSFHHRFICCSGSFFDRRD